MGAMNLSELFDSSVHILRKHCKSIILFNMAYWIVGIGVGIVIALLGIFGLVGTLAASDSLMGDPDWTGLVVLGGFAGVLMGVLMMGNHVGAILIASQETEGEKVPASRAIGASFRALPKVLLLTILSVLPMVPVLWLFFKLILSLFEGVAAFPGMMLGGSLETFTETEAMLIAGLLLLLVWLVFMLVISAYITLFSFSLQGMVLERLSAVASIRRSLQLVRGRYWYVFGVVSLLYMVIAGISMSLDSFFLAIAGLAELGLHFLGADPGYAFTFIYTYGRAIPNMAFGLLFGSLGAIVLTQLYYSRRFETEGYDLSLRLDRLTRAEKENGTS